MKCHMSLPYHSMWYHKILTRNKRIHIVPEACLTRKIDVEYLMSSVFPIIPCDITKYSPGMHATADSPAREKCDFHGVTPIFHCDLTKTHQEWAHTSCAPGGPLRGCWRSDTCRRPHCTLMVRSMSSSQGTSS